DSRGLARIGKVPVSETALDGLAKASLRAAESPSSDGLQHAGAEISDRLFPEAVRTFLAHSGPRHPQLQLADELLQLPWAQAIDGDSFIGETFAVSRQILSGSEYPEPRGVRVDVTGLRVVAFAEPGESARAASDYRSALSVINGLAVTWADDSARTTEQLRR